MVLSDELKQRLQLHLSLEFLAHYDYLALATYFKLSQVTLPGLAKYFQEESDEERQHADRLIAYCLQRDVPFSFPSIVPAQDYIAGKWALSPTESPSAAALQIAKDKETQIYQEVQQTLKLLTNYPEEKSLESLMETMISEQEQSLRKITQLQTLFTRYTSNQQGLGVALFDQSLLQGKLEFLN